jgi:CubicO group peptidase (beta-lactamase class C family)
MKRLVVFLASLMFVSPCLAQNTTVTDYPRVREALQLLELWVDAKRAFDDVPGMSMAVVYDQDIIWSKGFGLANREAQIPATPSTLYSICSISKLFTSIGLMQLRDAGHVHLDDPVSKHLEWFNIQDKYPDAPPVTVEGILTHSSGLPRESNQPYWSAPDFNFPTREQIIEGLSSQEELYPAFEYFQYSNLGLTLAGEIVAAASGQSYDDYIRARILDPLNMSSTYTDIPVAEHGQRMAVGYSTKRRDSTRPAVTRFEARGIAPAAGFASTVEDLAKFASWQFRVLHHGDEELMSRNTLREMQRVHWIDRDWEAKRGLGFGMWRADDKTYVGHGGSCPGYRSDFNLDPVGKVATIFMTNAGGVSSSMFTRRAQEIVGLAIEEAIEESEEKQPDSEDTTIQDLEIYLGTYDDAPWGHESAVIVWEGELAVVSLTSTDPLSSMMELEKTGEHTFRRVRDDDTLGEEIRFDIGADGRADKMWQHGNFSPRIR